MIWAEVDWSVCQGCNPCPARLACKPRAILKFDAEELAFVERDRCRGCAKCLPACSFTAIRLRKSDDLVSGQGLQSPI
ncbi:MAG TPA: hypothetical protein VF823_02600 [Anaerolineales bacterium]